MAHGQQRLEGDHGFVVLAVVAANHQNLLACHGACLRVMGCAGIVVIGAAGRVLTGYYVFAGESRHDRRHPRKL